MKTITHIQHNLVEPLQCTLEIDDFANKKYCLNISKLNYLTTGLL